MKLRERGVVGLDDRIGKHVASCNPDLKLGWKNSHWLGSDPVAALRRMKAEDGPDLLTQGSTDFLQTLFANGLVDEVIVTRPGKVKV